MTRCSISFSSITLATLSAFGLAASSLLTPAAASANGPPPLRREFRAAWIATVANIDWPSRPGLAATEQKKEMLELLKVAERLKLNAVVFQVRPACDALYASRLEPWSEYLTGEQGKPPEDGFDPLRFLVAEGHARGIQVHAWFNPYRASHPTAKSSPNAQHVKRTMPDAVVEYGKYLWLDPGSPHAEEHTLRVIADVVKRYDIDGVHFDDYFYPYPIKRVDDAGEATTEDLPFPDDNSWNAFLNQTPPGKKPNRDDWRRENVNRLIRRVNEVVKQEKPWVLFGVSPFGIWRPGYPEGIVGFDPYRSLYADSKLWLEEGWVDYCTPQLYWKIDSKGQSYPKLMAWWGEQNPHARHLWPGNYTSRINPKEEKSWPRSEIVQQVKLTQQSHAATGNVHFSIKALAQNRDGVADALAAGPYAEPAVIPATAWVEAGPRPSAPLAAMRGGKLHLQTPKLGDVWQWAVQVQQGDAWRTMLVPGDQLSVDIPTARAVAVRAIDRLGRESKVLLLKAQGLRR